MNKDENKDSILVVLPYGMCFRNIVLNDTFWGYLRNNYNIDLLTPLDIKSRETYGVRDIFSYVPKGMLKNLIHRLNHRLVYWWKFLDLAHFLLARDLGENLSVKYRWALSDKERRNILFLGSLRFFRLGKFFKKCLKKLPFLYPTSSVFKKRKYKFVVISHISDQESIITALTAAKRKIPVISITLGMDNYMHGPMQFMPDLMLLWGKEQEYEFVNFHLPLNKKLEKVKYKSIGCLIYDTYLEIQNNISKERFYKMYNIASDEEVILFPAFLENYTPGQRDLCQIIVDFIVRNNLKAKLLVRVRPNIDVELWEAFQKKYRTLVVLQTPSSASYDKSRSSGYFEKELEYKEMEIFVATIKYSTLLVCPSPSTMQFDAMCFNTPSIYAAFDWSGKGGSIPHAHQKFFLAKSVTYPHRKNLNAAVTEKEFLDLLHNFFVLKKRDNLLSKEIFDIVVSSSNDGQVGQRAVEAIKEFITTHDKQQK